MSDVPTPHTLIAHDTAAVAAIRRRPLPLDAVAAAVAVSARCRGS